MKGNMLVQQDQPPGVPPLWLTGERTLPDVPAENYWYQRHVAVYEWIAAQVAGKTVIDMACGEGYGSALLAHSAGTVIGVDANPEAHQHARLKYVAENLSFERDMVQRFGEPGCADAICFLQTIEHIEDPVEVLAHFKEILKPGGVAYISTPNLLTLAPAGAEKSDNPWHVREYRAHEFRVLCDSVFDSVTLYGVYHAGMLRLHERALRLGWDSLHQRMGITKRFYDWFTPAITSSDFELSVDRPLVDALDFLAVSR